MIEEKLGLFAVIKEVVRTGYDDDNSVIALRIVTYVTGGKKRSRFDPLWTLGQSEKIPR